VHRFGLGQGFHVFGIPCFTSGVSTRLEELDHSRAHFAYISEYSMPTSLSDGVAVRDCAVLWLFSPRRKALTLLEYRMMVVVLPNVRVNRETTAGRQARAGENVPRTTGPGLVACRWLSG
jgi:hypothetical protein